MRFFILHSILLIVITQSQLLFADSPPLNASPQIGAVKEHWVSGL
jgi:hypothetical protein